VRCDRAENLFPVVAQESEITGDDLKKSGFRIILTAVAAKGLDESWLGRELTEAEWPKLERLSKIHGIHLTGEGGEYESFVLDTPDFSKRIEVERVGRSGTVMAVEWLSKRLH